MNAILAIAIVVAVLVLMFVVAGVVIFVATRRAKKEQEASLPSGADISDFARELQTRYRGN